MLKPFSTEQLSFQKTETLILNVRSLLVDNKNSLRKERQKMAGIQALRAIAAIAVVMHHVSGQIISNMNATPFFSLYDIGDKGVQLFFSISGFIIFYAHFNDLSKPARILGYLLKRLLRIIPSTIVVATVWVLISKLAHALGIPGPDINFATWLSSAFVLPMLDEPSPVVIWTLRNEFLFYGVFALFIFNARLGAIAFAGWLITCVAIKTPPELSSIDSHILYNTAFADINTIFAFGLLAFLAYRHFSAEIASKAFLPLLTLFGYLAVHDQYSQNVPNLAFGISGGLLVYSAAQLHITNWLGKAAELIGDASYAIYLVHMPVIAVFYPLARALSMPPNLIYISESVLCVFVGLAFYKIFEKPFANMISRYRRSNKMLKTIMG